MQAVDKHNKYQHFTYDIFKYPQIADSLICGVFASLAFTCEACVFEAFVAPIVVEHEQEQELVTASRS